MCALIPPPLSSFGLPSEDVINHHHHHQQSYYNSVDAGWSDQSFTLFPISPPSLPPQIPVSFAAHSADDDPHLGADQKLKHNASERDRRRKINYLYSSLRSLLPAGDQSKKFSIPATVSRVLKYIPELQYQVEKLVQRKEELLSKISKRDERVYHEDHRKATTESSLTVVSASCLSHREVVVHISTHKVHKIPLSDILLNLENDGLALINCTTFESFGNMVIWSLHFQVEGAHRLECDALSKNIVALYWNKQPFYP